MSEEVTRPLATRLSRVAITVGIAAAGALLGAVASGARGAEASVDPRPAVELGADGVPRVSVDLAPLADDAVRARLESGLAQTIVTRIDGFAPGRPEPVATLSRTCRVRFDEWDARYEARLESDGDVSVLVTASLTEVIELCLDLHDLAIGRAEDWPDRIGASASFVVVATLNPLSRETAQRIHRWLEQGDTSSGLSFFGAFVALLVDARIGDAERALHPSHPPP